MISFFKACFGMHISIVAVLIALCGAEKLDRTYLPPPLSAKSAGGDSKDLLTPFSSSDQNLGINFPVSSDYNQRLPQNYQKEPEIFLNNNYRSNSEPFNVNNNRRQPDEYFDNNRHPTPNHQPNKVSSPSKNNFRSFQDTQSIPEDYNLQTYRNEGRSNYNSLKPSQIDLNRNNPYQNQNKHSVDASKQNAFSGTSQNLNYNHNSLNKGQLPSQKNQEFQRNFNGFPDQQSFRQNHNQNFDKNYSENIPIHTTDNTKDIVRPQSIQEQSAEILKLENEINDDGFHFSFETNNGIRAESNGFTSNGVQTQGGYSYIGDDGEIYTVRYTADEGGFQPIGDHLPTPPPIPEAILRSLEQNLRDEAAGIEDDGMYNPSKYGDDQYFNPQIPSNNLNYNARNNLKSKQVINDYPNQQYSPAEIQNPLNDDASYRENFQRVNTKPKQGDRLRNYNTANERLTNNAFKQSNLNPISQQKKGMISISDKNREKPIFKSFPSTDTRKITPESNQIIQDFQQNGRSFENAPTINDGRLQKGPEYLPPKQIVSRPQNGHQPLSDIKQNPTQQYQPSSFGGRVNSMFPEQGSPINYNSRLNSELVDYNEQPINNQKQVPKQTTNFNREFSQNENRNTQKLRIPSQTSQPRITDRFHMSSNVNSEQTRDVPCRNKACGPNHYSEINENDYQVSEPKPKSFAAQNSVNTDTDKIFVGSNSLRSTTQPPIEIHNKNSKIYNYPRLSQQNSGDQNRNKLIEHEQSQYQESAYSSEPSEFNLIGPDSSHLSSQNPENTYIENEQQQDFSQNSFLPENNEEYNTKPQQYSSSYEEARQIQENNYSNDNPYEPSKEDEKFENGFKRPLSDQFNYPLSDASEKGKELQDDREKTSIANQIPFEEPAPKAQLNKYANNDFYPSQQNNHNQQSASQKQQPQYQDQQQNQRISYQPQTTPQQSFSFSTTELNAEGTEVPTQQYDGELYQYNKPDPVSTERGSTADSGDSTTPTSNIITVTSTDTQSTQTIEPSSNQNRHEEFPRFRQPPRFDDQTGYHY